MTSTSHVFLIVTFTPPARAMYLIGDMAARTRLTPSSYNSSKVVRAVCSSEKSEIPSGGPRTAERLVDPLLSRTRPHCSGSSDHPRLRLHLTPLVRLYFLLENGLNNNRAPNRYGVHGSLSFLWLLPLHGVYPALLSIATGLYFAICLAYRRSKDPVTASLCCVCAISGLSWNCHDPSAVAYLPALV